MLEEGLALAPAQPITPDTRYAGTVRDALTGQTGGSVRKLAHLTIRVPAVPIEQGGRCSHDDGAQPVCGDSRALACASAGMSGDDPARDGAGSTGAVEELIAAADLYEQESSALAAP